MSKQRSWLSFIALVVCLMLAFAMPGYAETIHNAQFTMHNEGNEGPIIPEDPEATGESGSAGESKSTTETATETETTAETDPIEAAALGGVPIEPFTVGDDINVGDIRYTIISEPENGGNGTVSVLSSVSVPGPVDLVIPGSISYNEKDYDVTAIGSAAFSGCFWLKSVTIPGSVETIGIYAFVNCTALESVTISEGVIEIGDDAFRDCGLLRSVAIPGSVETIGDSAFEDCGSLESVIISEGVKAIGDYAFDNCTALGSVTIPGGVETIGEFAFYDCDSLESVTIPGSVETIGIYAFASCIALEIVTIAEGVLEIGDSAFHYCDSLETITIPGSVETIGENAFAYCDTLTEAIFEGSSAPEIGTNAFFNTADEAQGTAYYPGNGSGYDDAWKANFPVNWIFIPVEDKPVDPVNPIDPSDGDDDNNNSGWVPSGDDDNDDDGPSSYYSPFPIRYSLWMTAANRRNPSRESLGFGVRVSAWELLTGSYYHDSVRNNAVEVRTYFDDPGLFTADSYVSGWTTGADVDRVRALFEKRFTNKIRVIHFDRVGLWEHPVRVAAKVDLAGWDTTRLVFYAYDPKTGYYRKLAAPAYWIDANGYLRLQTEYAGELIVAEGELEKR